MNRDINKLFLVSVSEYFDLELYNTLSLLISTDKKSRLDNYTSYTDKKLGLYSELLLRIAIHQDLNIENHAISFAISNYGKPFLENNQSYYFNISHTRTMIAVATSNNPVGVDIEKIVDVNLGIAERFFTKSEMAYIEQIPQRIYERFFEVWTKKEAYIKYLGKGLSVPLNSFEVSSEVLSKHFYTVEYGKYITNMFCADENVDPTTILMPEAGLVDLAKDLLP